MGIPGLGKMGNQFRILLNLGFIFLLFVSLLDRVNILKSPPYLSGFSPRASYRWSLAQFEPEFRSKRPDNSVFLIKNITLAEAGDASLGEDHHQFSRIQTSNILGAPMGNLSVKRQSFRRTLVENSTKAGIIGVGESDGVDSLSSCAGLEKHVGYANRCEFIKAHKQCTCGGVIEYTTFFYCTCKNWPLFGYAVLGLWLVALFYMLGNTAADYFCCSLEKLSKLLKLPPTVAGVTLLPLGNGAPDVFASIAAFVGADAGEVGLNSVLGGAIFVTCIVAGSVALFVAGSNVQIDRRCFVRDVCFFLFTLTSLCLILIVGKVNLWGAIAFLSIYVMYACTVAANEFSKKKAQTLKRSSMTPMHPVLGSSFSLGAEDEDDSMYSPLLDLESTTGFAAGHALIETTLPQWMWASNVAIYSNVTTAKTAEDTRPLWGWSEDSENNQSRCSLLRLLMCLVNWPLTLPRRVTIPIVENDRWSKTFAVVSVILAPILLSLLWNAQETKPFGIGKLAYAAAGISGAIFGSLAYFRTNADHPPRTFLFPWVAGGFIMSIVWFYIIANELVALLVSFGVIFEINPSILGLTVLAWGNSMGDLMSNIALALNGGDGVQIALSGCYAGPMFNTLAGLGISLLLGSWSAQPAAYLLPKDTSLFYTLGFLVAGLVFALIVLPMNDMRPSKLLGIGLLTLYSSFLILRLSNALGLFTISGLY
ncbi:hypothetical protein SUGI_0927480 [Cryptomeria japonica]|uniref:cation/calcium exchanger 4 n=1 Tax=Cryptomeria japonica TaxID=3369 RepID=UPI002414913A|nr:cation/calcium exchanger 4 [Cryptomeria japonica]GLJ44312.1 hypothetical protein SUGI_0927480 [Cryptomeria japonica]